MTNEEAKEVLAMYRFKLIQSISNQLEGDIEAFDVAIKALEQQPCEDCINLNKLDDIITKAIDDSENQTECQTLRWVLDVMSELPSVIPQQARWIPISERLPRDSGYYLTTTMYDEVYCDYWEGECFGRTEAVIAWMPLPEPYEADKEVADDK